MRGGCNPFSWDIVKGFSFGTLVFFCLLAQATAESRYVAPRSSSTLIDDVDKVAHACRIGRIENRLHQCLKAAAMGDIDAPYILAKAYSRGWYGAPINEAEATKWYLVASKNGGGIAQVQLGIRYLCGIGVKHDDKIAKAWFKKATEHGKSSGLSWMGFISENGLGGDRDLKAAYEWYVRGIEFQDEDSLFGLGMLYLDGQAVKANAVEAQRLLQLAEKRFMYLSILGIGVYNANGEIDFSENRPSSEVEQDLIMATRERAEHGDVEAAFNLGLAYSGGYGVEKDYIKAFNWFQRAALKQYSPAQFNLAQLYLRGWGVTKDLNKSADMFKHASDNGDMRATFALGWMVMHGLGVTQDLNHGLDLIRKAAISGDPEAQSILAVLYAEGLTTPRDLNAAKEWWSRKMSCGHFERRN
jgi:TPR repeat protein